MKLWAISDLHLSNPINLEAFLALKGFDQDWLILAGDIAERFETLEIAFSHASQIFSRVIWVPGNHELWAIPENESVTLSGLARYNALVKLARRHGIFTPEDPYLSWPPSVINNQAGIILAPLFLLYDYSFGPDSLSRDEMIAWAREQSSVAADEQLLQVDPYLDIVDWCHNRLALSEKRLQAIDPRMQTVLINHFPLRKDLIYIPRIPRFIPWCGTKHTDDWHKRFRAAVVVSGHLHVRRTDWRDQTRFEEVSLGYPSQWDTSLGIEAYMRQIFP